MPILNHFIDESIAFFHQQSAVEPMLVDDGVDLAATWSHSLAGSLRSDLHLLTDLLGHPLLGQKSFSIEDPLAEGALRAASAIRMRLQQHYLMDVAPHVLESGQVDPQVLAEDAQQAYVAYQLLGALQVSILAGMDPQLLS